MTAEATERLASALAEPGPALRSRVGKRVFDVVVAASLLALALPVLLVVGAAVAATSRGGPLFRQVRVGRGGLPFVMFKFRTMRAGCSDEPHRAYVQKLLTEAEPPVGGACGLYKLEHDPRVTQVGRVLRRTSLDEVPQLWNVLIGSMSLVGPRPALPWEAEMFTATHRQRFLVTPGLTGLWQVNGRSKLPMSAGLDLDVEYVHRQSFRLDLLILLKTIPAVLAAVGVR